MRRNPGFTLIELMIVLAIVALLAVILMPNFLRARAQGQFSSCKSNLRNVAAALEMYSSDNAGRYPNALANLWPRYLAAIPTCASAGRATYDGGYDSDSNPDEYTLFCRGTNHAGVDAPSNYPQFNSGEGLVER